MAAQNIEKRVAGFQLTKGHSPIRFPKPDTQELSDFYVCDGRWECQLSDLEYVNIGAFGVGVRYTPSPGSLEQWQEITKWI